MFAMGPAFFQQSTASGSTYATWDPANSDLSNITLSSGNSLATGTSGGGIAKSTHKITVPTYFEMIVYNGGGSGECTGAGVVDATVPNSSGQLLTTTKTISAWLNFGNIYSYYAVLATITTPATSRLCLCVTPSTRKIWVKEIAGAYPGSGDPTAGTGETGVLTGSSYIYAAANPYSSGATVKLCADPATFAGTAPSGFAAGF